MRHQTSRTHKQQQQKNIIYFPGELNCSEHDNSSWCGHGLLYFGHFVCTQTMFPQIIHVCVHGKRFSFTVYHRIKSGWYLPWVYLLKIKGVCCFLAFTHTLKLLKHCECIPYLIFDIYLFYFLLMKNTNANFGLQQSRCTFTHSFLIAMNFYFMNTNITYTAESEKKNSLFGHRYHILLDSE